MLSVIVKIQTHLANLRDDEGATAVEYGLMAALIAVVIIGTVTALGTRLDGVFGTVRDALPAA
jgi:pilus assembly protein Flp/PilA